MSQDAWSPPTQRMRDGGAIIFNDWQSIRPAIEAAYEALGREVPKNIPAEDWNLIGLAISAYEYQMRPKCSGCKGKVRQHEVIRCLDCKAALCERCAPAHFWPNGRPRGDRR